MSDETMIQSVYKEDKVLTKAEVLQILGLGADATPKQIVDGIESYAMVIGFTPTYYRLSRYLYCDTPDEVAEKNVAANKRKQEIRKDYDTYLLAFVYGASSAQGPFGAFETAPAAFALGYRDGNKARPGMLAAMCSDGSDCTLSQPQLPLSLAEFETEIVRMLGRPGRVEAPVSWVKDFVDKARK